MMSGTSADGIDLAAISIDDAPRPRVRVLATAHHDYDPALRARVLGAGSGEPARTHDLASLHAALGDAYADSASSFLPGLSPRPQLIELQGQTCAPPSR